MPRERKHIEAIERVIDRDEQFIDAATTVALRAAITSALAACDESPCAWSRHPVMCWLPGCLSASSGISYGPLVTMIGVDENYAWTVCPHCGRKIQEANDA